MLLSYYRLFFNPACAIIAPIQKPHPLPHSHYTIVVRAISSEWMVKDKANQKDGVTKRGWKGYVRRTPPPVQSRTHTDAPASANWRP